MTINAPGSIILLNGGSSSGKSSLAKALQSLLDVPFLHVSSDHMLDGMLPQRWNGDQILPWWAQTRARFFHGFHRCIAAFAESGNHLVMDHLMETAQWRRELCELLQGYDVFLVGVQCAVDEVDRRESLRGDRRVGEGRIHIEVDRIHDFGRYDFVVDTTTGAPSELAEMVATAWRNRLASVPGALFDP